MSHIENIKVNVETSIEAYFIEGEQYCSKNCIFRNYYETGYWKYYCELYGQDLEDSWSDTLSCEQCRKYVLEKLKEK